MDRAEARLQVPGAELFYRVQGSGPLLLFIQGGDGDADGCTPVIEALAQRYSVVTYDPRGLSRSRLDGPPESLTVETHGEDACRLLAALTDAPAIVVGISRGAMVALDLVSRHGGQVGLLVAHEPPATQVLPPAERERAAQAQRGVEMTAERDGPMAAMVQFARALDLDFSRREPDCVIPAAGPGRMANLTFFLAYDAPAVRTCSLDVEALKAAPTRIVIGAGEQSGAVFTHHCAVALAEALDAPLVIFPGGHAGPTTHPKGFAARLLETLQRYGS